MENLKLQAKVTLTLLCMIMSVLLIAVPVMLGQVDMRSTVVLIVSWWLSFTIAFVAIVNSRGIYGFVKRTIQHQRTSPAGYNSTQFEAMLLLLLTAAAVIYFFGGAYIAVLQSGSGFERTIAIGFTVFLVSMTKTYGYHHQAKRAKIDQPVAEHQTISLFN